MILGHASCSRIVTRSDVPCVVMSLVFPDDEATHLALCVTLTPHAEEALRGMHDPAGLLEIHEPHRQPFQALIVANVQLPRHNKGNRRKRPTNYVLQNLDEM